MAALSRARLILPSEHGSWAMLFTPFIIGAGLAWRGGLAVLLPAAVWLCALAALALFLLRQPLTLLVRVVRHRARPADAAPAWFWTLALGLIAGGAGAALLLMDRWAILWLAAPAAAILGATIAIGARVGPRSLAVELIGVAGLALAAPAAYVAATGRLDLLAWLSWLIGAAHSVITVLYVRLRIDELHQRASRPQRLTVVAAHALALAAVIAGAAAQIVPALVMLPLGLLLLRALYVGWQQPPLGDVKRFGLLETGFALAFAAMVIAAFAWQA